MFDPLNPRNPPDDARKHAPATERNRGPILEVLRRVLPPQGLVLEVASGTGQHAVAFAQALPGLIWQPSDPDPDLRASTRAWAVSVGVPNLRDPLDLNAAAADWPIDRADAVVCINMIHIAPWTAALGLFAGAARLLPAGAPLLLYGPFRRDGGHTAPSNAEFDASLKARNPAWGVRDLGEVGRAATGFTLSEVVEMPANNLTVLLRRR
ncbi:class I SAM-dependent methyltransferase [Azospirillum canadense]|uniref:class I SAM-dependent methyltransferase n=1 Tax=Azospirillum canadense TaxID=403962 RepID=UPI00222647D6|nr:class I SAM-dependent methyltransferase [Azospirillum canadense]MCW2238292.1 SAM-dependent methyltransferase [Azospirillum canadense]